MSVAKLREEIKKGVDRLPPARLESVADYVRFLSRPSISQRIVAAEKAIASGKSVNWRKVVASVQITTVPQRIGSD